MQWARPSVLAVVLLLVLSTVAVGAATRSAARAAGLDPSSTQWLSVQEIENKTPYELRLLDSTKTEMTDWLAPATETIRPRGEGRSDGHSVVRNSSVAIGHGVAQLIIYGLHLDGKYDGMIVLASGVGCTQKIPVEMTCTQHHRWLWFVNGNSSIGRVSV
jgi:hypothetical protein